ncbi:MAG: glycosyltransferase family 4 protein [Opitutaceae bacterium]|nr:glycosyltransferase family 4 protein [Cytophagales bacterium]
MASSKNILLLTFWYPNKYNKQFYVFVQEHARAIHVSGNNIKVLAVHFLKSNKFYNVYDEVEIDSFGFEVRHLYIESYFYKWIHINPWHCFQIVEKFFKSHYEGFNTEIIHSNIVGVCAITGMKLSQKYKLKHVITEHWTRVERYMANNKLSYLGKRAYNTADAITVVSDFLGGIVGKYVKDKTTIYKVANVIDSNIFSYREKEIHPNRLTFSFIGHLRLPKLPVLVVDALEEYAKTTNKEITLYMFGEGPQKSIIEKKIPELHFKIVLRGLRPKTELAETLQKSDVYLHGSSYETFCVAIAEALCTGIPVLCSNNTAIPELINNSTGILVEDNVLAWKNGLIDILKKKYKHEAISQSVRERFSYSAIGSEFSSLYNSM